MYIYMYSYIFIYIYIRTVSLNCFRYAPNRHAIPHCLPIKNKALLMLLILNLIILNHN